MPEFSLLILKELLANSAIVNYYSNNYYDKNLKCSGLNKLENFNFNSGLLELM